MPDSPRKVIPKEKWQSINQSSYIDFNGNTDTRQSNGIPIDLGLNNLNIEVNDEWTKAVKKHR